MALLLALSPLHSQTWTQLHPAGGPSGAILNAYIGAAGYDSATNRMIVYYSTNPPGFGQPASEVWVVTNANGLGGTPVWTKLSPIGSAPETAALTAGAYDPTTNRLVVYGGCYSNCGFSQSFVFTLTNANGLGGTPEWIVSSVNNPRPRSGHTALLDPATNRLISFGGHLAFFGTDHNDVGVLSNANGSGGPSTWTALNPAGTLPDVRDEAGANYDASTNRMMVFAGNRLNPNHTIDEFNDFWLLAAANGNGVPVWTALNPTGPIPHTRLRHSQVYDAANNRVLVFGGNTEIPCCSSFGDLWQLSGANGTGSPAWTMLPQTGDTPGPNSLHRAVFDAAHQRMIVYGGFDGNGVGHNHLWVLELNPNQHNVCLLYDPAKPVKSGATLPVKLQLCSSSGQNQSDSNLVLHAVQIEGVGNPTNFLVNDAGNSNPDNNFRFESGSGNSGSYIFNLKTTGLTAGNYLLKFTASDGSSVYSAPLVVR